MQYLSDLYYNWYALHGSDVLNSNSAIKMEVSYNLATEFLSVYSKVVTSPTRIKIDIFLNLY